MVVIDKQDAYLETMRVAARAQVCIFKRIVFPCRAGASSILVILLSLSERVCVDKMALVWFMYTVCKLKINH